MPHDRPRVLITEAIHPSGVERLARHVDVIYLPDRPTESVDQHLPDIDGIVVRTAPLTAARLERAARLRVIAKHGVGVDNVDVAAARARGITITFTPGANSQAVAEHALTLMLVLARRVALVSRMLRQGEFDRARQLAVAEDLHGKTLGLVGLGNVGARLAAICRQGLAMRVLAFDPYVTAARTAELGVEHVTELPPLLQQSDVISVHAPLTPETRGIIGATALAQMKPTAILINCARGGLVDEGALLEVLRANRIAGAGLDTFSTEPLPTDHPLLQLENVVVTPHVAGASQEAFKAMAETLADDVLHVLRGESPVHPLR